MIQFIKNLFGHDEKLGANPRSGKWPAVRKRFLEGKVCGICGGTKKLEAHHIRPYHFHQELELDEENLFPLCEGNKNMNCHLEFGHFGNFATKYNEYIKVEAPIWAARFVAKSVDQITQ